MRDDESSAWVEEPVQERSNVVLHLGLFVATVGVIFYWWSHDWVSGGLYALGLLSILLAHEFGHYFAARYYGVPVSLPYFIPGFPPFYTFGAFIKMQPSRMDPEALLVIGAAGPLAGMVVAVPVYVVGMMLSDTAPIPELMGPDELLIFGDSLLSWGVASIVFGELPEGTDVMLHPLAYGGWVGFFVTALNLVPIGQLDGGHIGYAMMGRAYHRVARRLFVPLVLCGALIHPVWLVLAIFLVFTGVEHPPLTDERTPLPRWCRWMGYGCLVIFVLTFVPRPIHVVPLYELIWSLGGG